MKKQVSEVTVLSFKNLTTKHWNQLVPWPARVRMHLMMVRAELELVRLRCSKEVTHR